MKIYLSKYSSSCYWSAVCVTLTDKQMDYQTKSTIKKLHKYVNKTDMKRERTVWCLSQKGGLNSINKMPDKKRLRNDWKLGSVRSDSSVTLGHTYKTVTLHIREVFIIMHSSKANLIKMKQNRTKKIWEKYRQCLTCLFFFRMNEHNLTTTKKNVLIDRHTEIEKRINIFKIINIITISFPFKLYKNTVYSIVFALILHSSFFRWTFLAQFCYYVEWVR